jgi:DNA-binding transcriptional MerR regulator
MTLLLISELARETGVTPRTIRLYEQMGLLAAASRRFGGQRRYDEDSVARILLIRRIKAGGLPLARIAQVLQALDANSDPELALSALQVLEARLETIREHRRELLAVENDLLVAIANLTARQTRSAPLRSARPSHRRPDSST